jgi:type IV secretory pathway TraG/TraD family ATPase VirD4
MDEIWKLISGEKEQQYETLHGSSRFMTKREEQDILSRWNKGVVVDGKRRISRTKTMHTLILASTGGGKSVWISANLLKPKGDSYIVTDTSGELFKLTSKYLEKKGYKILHFNLSQDGAKGLHYNPLAFLKTDSDIQRFSKVLLQAQGLDKGNDPFWQISTEQLFFVLIKAILKMPPEQQTLQTLYHLVDLCTADIEQAEGVLTSSMDDELYLKFSAFKNYSEKLRTSVLATASAVLSPLNDSYIQQLTSKNDLDISLLRKQKTILYIQNSERDLAHTAFLRNLLLKDIFYNLLAPRGKNEKRVYAFLDEFANVYVPDFTTLITVSRKYDLSLTCALQDLQQLKQNYPNAENTILSNFQVKIVLPGLNADSSEQISKLSGMATVTSEDKEHQKTALTARRLLTADEIRTLSSDEGIMIFSNKLPIKLKMKPWYKSFWLRMKLGMY